MSATAHARNAREARSARAAQVRRRPARIEIATALAKLLTEHKLCSRFSGDDDYVFHDRNGSAALLPERLSARARQGPGSRRSRRGRQAKVLDARLAPYGDHAPDPPRCRCWAGSSLRRPRTRPSMTLDKYTHEFEARTGNEVATPSEPPCRALSTDACPARNDEARFGGPPSF
jgi:hypothetical protein